MALVLGSSLGLAANALAMSAPIQIANTGGEGVFIRPQPNTSQPAVGWMPEGASPDYNCFVWGQDINGVPIWFNVNYNGVTGYYASYYDNSSYHSNEELTAKYGVPLCGSTPPPESAPESSPAPESPPSSGGGSLVFTVFNAEGGIYYRNSPHWSDTSATPGVGVYNGDQVQLICGAFGDPVGPFNDTAWSYVNNLSRSVGSGWVDEHFINDGAPDNAFVAGEPMCGPETPGVSGGGSSGGGSGSGGGGSSGGGESGGGGASNPPPGGSLYYSPFPTKTRGWIEYKGGPFDAFNIHTYAPSPADINLGSEQWHNGADCNAYRAIPGGLPPGVSGGFTGSAPDGKLITTLAGWSSGRIGPIMFLDVGYPWRSQIHYILLFDPGSKSDYYDGVCDKQYPSMSNIVANWLIENPQNKLVVLAGDVTADYKHPVNGYGHAGIQNKLFPAIRDTYVGGNRNIRKQVVVCNYPGMNHGDVWIKFRQYMNMPPITPATCPKIGHYQHIESWNP
jgi:hypothetical protein